MPNIAPLNLIQDPKQFIEDYMQGLQGQAANMIENNQFLEGLDPNARNLYDSLSNYYGSSDKFIDQLKELLSTGDYRNLQGYLSNLNGFRMTPEMEKWLDNMIGQQSTLENRSWEENMANNDLLRAGQQLQQLGLSASGVLDTGGSKTNYVDSAANVKSNVAMQRYEMRMQLARQLLGMTSQMASAGVYGKAIGAARKASGIVTSAASHTALHALNPKGITPKPGELSDGTKITQDMVRAARFNAYK